MIIQTPYFHGTDFRILRMTKEERLGYKAGALEIAGYFWSFFAPHMKTGLRDFHSILSRHPEPHFLHNLLVALECYRLHKAGDPQYQYEDNCIYITSNAEKASDYANNAFAGGEAAKSAFRMVQALTILRPNILSDNPGIIKKMEHLLSFGQAPAQPCVCWIRDIDSAYLQNDFGEPYDPKTPLLFQNARYNKAVTLDPANAMPLRDFDAMIRFLHDHHNITFL